MATTVTAAALADRCELGRQAVSRLRRDMQARVDLSLESASVDPAHASAVTAVTRFRTEVSKAAKSLESLEKSWTVNGDQLLACAAMYDKSVTELDARCGRVDTSLAVCTAPLLRFVGECEPNVFPGLPQYTPADFDESSLRHARCNLDGAVLEASGPGMTECFWTDGSMAPFQNVIHVRVLDGNGSLITGIVDHHDITLFIVFDDCWWNNTFSTGTVRVPCSVWCDPDLGSIRATYSLVREGEEVLPVAARARLCACLWEMTIESELSAIPTEIRHETSAVVRWFEQQLKAGIDAERRALDHMRVNGGSEVSDEWPWIDEDDDEDVGGEFESEGEDEANVEVDDADNVVEGAELGVRGDGCDSPSDFFLHSGGHRAVVVDKTDTNTMDDTTAQAECVDADFQCSTRSDAVDGVNVGGGVQRPIIWETEEDEFFSCGAVVCSVPAPVSVPDLAAHMLASPWVAATVFEAMEMHTTTCFNVLVSVETGVAVLAGRSGSELAAFPRLCKYWCIAMRGMVNGEDVAAGMRAFYLAHGPRVLRRVMVACADYEGVQIAACGLVGALMSHYGGKHGRDTVRAEGLLHLVYNVVIPRFVASPKVQIQAWNIPFDSWLPCTDAELLEKLCYVMDAYPTRAHVQAVCCNALYGFQQEHVVDDEQVGSLLPRLCAAMDNYKVLSVRDSTYSCICETVFRTLTARGEPGCMVTWGMIPRVLWVIRNTPSGGQWVLCHPVLTAACEFLERLMTAPASQPFVADVLAVLEDIIGKHGYGFEPPFAILCTVARDKKNHPAIDEADWFAQLYAGLAHEGYWQSSRGSCIRALSTLISSNREMFWRFFETGGLGVLFTLVKDTRFRNLSDRVAAFQLAHQVASRREGAAIMRKAWGVQEYFRVLEEDGRE